MKVCVQESVQICRGNSFRREQRPRVAVLPGAERFLVNLLAVDDQYELGGYIDASACQRLRAAFAMDMTVLARTS